MASLPLEPLQRDLAHPHIVLVVDDDVSTIGVVARVVRDLGGIPRVAQSSESALELARGQAPDVVVAALEIGGVPRGLSLGRTVRQRFNSMVILTGPDLPMQHVASVAGFGPDGFLCKPLRSDQVDVTLRLALRRRASQQSAVAEPADREPELARALRQIAAVVNGTGLVDLGPPTALGPGAATLAGLRPREQEVVHLLFEHCRVPAIAERLGISPQTVRNHLKHVFLQLGVHSQQELMARLRGVHTPSSVGARRSAT